MPPIREYFLPQNNSGIYFYGENLHKIQCKSIHPSLHGVPLYNSANALRRIVTLPLKYTRVHSFSTHPSRVSVTYVGKETNCGINYNSLGPIKKA